MELIMIVMVILMTMTLQLDNHVRVVAVSMCVKTEFSLVRGKPERMNLVTHSMMIVTA